MSRIGRKPITIPEKVKVEQKSGFIEITGPLGKIDQKIPKGISLKIDNNVATLVPDSATDDSLRSLHGLSRTLVQNAITGVVTGFKKDLEIQGLGYRAQIAGSKLTLALGFASPIEFMLPAGIKATVDPKQTLISISGVDAYLVGEVAARIRRLKKPEPYKGSGVRYVGERIIRKAGKAAAGAVGGGAGGKK
jgi:large subunit ribosomal protein L6